MTKKRKRKIWSYEDQKKNGWFKLHRALMDHPIFGNDPLSKRETFIWMLGRATYMESGRLIVLTGTQLRLMRGQFSDSLEYLAQAWGWDDCKVARWFKKLVSAGMIKVDSENGQNIVTICNYNKYQDYDIEIEVPNEEASREMRESDEDNNNKGNKVKKVKPSTASPLGASGSGSKAPLLNRTETLAEPWSTIIRGALGDNEYRAWIANAIVGDDNSIICPTSFFRTYCSNNFEKTVREALAMHGISFNGFIFREQAANGS